MRFAINYSPQAEKLWCHDLIQVDLFKCPDWHDLVASVSKMHKVYVHCSLYVGSGLHPQLDLGALRQWLDSTETLVINTHLAVLKSDLPPKTANTAETIIEYAVRDLEILGERFGMERVVVENVPYQTKTWYGELLPEVVDPALISEVVRRSGCGFLLDIAHAIRSCEGTGCEDVKAYINAMPVHVLRELHIVGITPESDALGIRSDHFPMTEADWDMAEWAIGQIRAGCWAKPDTLAFEYGGIGEKFEGRSESAVIAEQAPRLYQLAKSV